MLLRKCAVAISCAAILVTFTQLAFAQSEVVFTTNYDLQLTIDGENRRVNSRARVRDGHTVPIPFQNYRVDLQFTAVAEGQFRIDLLLFERTDNSSRSTLNSTYSQINLKPVQIEGALGIPLELKSTIVDIDVDLAIVVSKYGP